MVNKKNLCKIILLLVIVPNIFSCTRLLQLKKSLSDDVIISIKSNRLPIGYSIKSDLDELINKNNIQIPLNKSLKINIDEYMKNKFSDLRNDQNGYFILFQIKDMSIEQNYNADFGSTIMGSVLKEKNIVYGQSDFSSRIILNVKLYQNNQLIADKDIISTSNSNTVVNEYNSSSYIYESYQKVLDQSINKCILLVDKYLASINI